MALSAADKRWHRKMVREEIASLLDDILAGQIQQAGGYDGATEYKDDDWADESRKRRRIGFAIVPGGHKKTLKK